MMVAVALRGEAPLLGKGWCGTRDRAGTRAGQEQRREHKPPAGAGFAVAAGLNYTVRPDGYLVMTFTTPHGPFQLAVAVEGDGRVLQIRSLGYWHCPAGVPTTGAVLEVLAGLNYRLRQSKFGWDKRSGEIAVYSDIWLEDAPLTAMQFTTVLQAFLHALDDSLPQIQEVMFGSITPFGA